MINHHIYTALALDHKQSQMEAARRVHQARLCRLRAGTSDARRSLLGRIANRLRPSWSRVGGHRLRPEAKGRTVVLRDGSTVLIRQVRGTDAPLHYLTEVDHHDHEALGALNHADGRGVGIARPAVGEGQLR